MKNSNRKLELSDLIDKYREAARLHGEATERGDFKVANKSANAISAIHLEITNRGEHATDALLALITDTEPGVRMWAASHLLDQFPTMAEPVLEQLASSTRLVGMSALKTLEEWRAGRLAIGRAR